MQKKKLSTHAWHERFVQQASWTKTIRNYLFSKASLTPKSYILEVGCGTCAILSQIQGGLKLGIDIDLKFLKFSQKALKDLYLIQGDGHQMPFSSKVFDLVFCHYLLLWVDNPGAMLKEFARIGKPGAKVIILAEPDYGGRIDYPPTLKSLGQAQTKSLQNQGSDPFIGRKLLHMAQSAGMKILESGVLGSQSSNDPDPKFIKSEWDILKSDLSDELSNEELLKFQQIDLQAWNDGIRVLFVPTFYLIAEI